MLTSAVKVIWLAPGPALVVQGLAGDPLPPARVALVCEPDPYRLHLGTPRHLGGEELLEQGSSQHPEPWDSAADRVLDVARLMNPQCEQVDELLAWDPHKAHCDRNVKLAKEIVDETIGLSPEWVEKFERLCEEYEEACQRRDRERSEEISFTLIPQHYKTDAQLQERVGGMMSARDDAERTSGTDSRRGTLIEA